MRPSPRLVRTLWITVALLAVTGFSAGLEQTLRLAGSSQMERFLEWAYGEVDKFRPLKEAGVDPKTLGRYDAHTVPMFLHVAPGMLFMVLGPLQFLPGLRARHIRLHRWSGRIFLVSGAAIGLTALLLIARVSLIGGSNEGFALGLFAVVFLVALARAFLHIRRREIALHREWMIRAFAIGLASATVRPFVSFLFAFTPMTMRELFGIACWLAFTLHLLAAEIWINYTRKLQTA